MSTSASNFSSLPKGLYYAIDVDLSNANNAPLRAILEGKQFGLVMGRGSETIGECFEATVPDLLRRFDLRYQVPSATSNFAASPAASNPSTSPWGEEYNNRKKFTHTHQSPSPSCDNATSAVPTHRHDLHCTLWYFADEHYKAQTILDKQAFEKREAERREQAEAKHKAFLMQMQSDNLPTLGGGGGPLSSPKNQPRTSAWGPASASSSAPSTSSPASAWVSKAAPSTASAPLDPAPSASPVATSNTTTVATDPSGVCPLTQYIARRDAYTALLGQKAMFRLNGIVVGGTNGNGVAAVDVSIIPAADAAAGANPSATTTTCCAVRSFMCQNKYPHLTLTVGAKAKPVSSNWLLATEDAMSGNEMTIRRNNEEMMELEKEAEDQIKRRRTEDGPSSLGGGEDAAALCKPSSTNPLPTSVYVNRNEPSSTTTASAAVNAQWQQTYGNACRWIPCDGEVLVEGVVALH